MATSPQQIQELRDAASNLGSAIDRHSTANDQANQTQAELEQAQGARNAAFAEFDSSVTNLRDAETRIQAAVAAIVGSS